MKHTTTYKWWRNTNKEATKLDLKSMTKLFDLCNREPEPNNDWIFYLMVVKSWCKGFAEINGVDWIEIYICMYEQEFI